MEKTIVVNFELTIDQMIAHGNYVCLIGTIQTNKIFPPAGLFGKKIVLNTKLFNFNYCTSEKSIREEMGKEGYRPANIWELLSYGETYSEDVKEFPIGAADQTCYDPHDPYVLGLDYLGGDRCITALFFDQTIERKKVYLNYRYLGIHVWNFV